VELCPKRVAENLFPKKFLAETEFCEIDPMAALEWPPSTKSVEAARVRFIL
jgi:hypothetical protein